MGRRIRSIKPEIIEDRRTAELSDMEFRLYVSFITLADDYGNLRGNYKFLYAQIYWQLQPEAALVDAAIDSLIERGLVEPYEVRGTQYLHIIGWDKHQRVDKPGKPGVPGKDDPEANEPQTWKTYFVRLGNRGEIKIGKTLNVLARIEKLQTAAPGPLMLLGVVDENIEAWCHQRFNKDRVHGEWFTPTPELLNFIAERCGTQKSNMVLETVATDLDMDQDMDPDQDLSASPKGSAVDRTLDLFAPKPTPVADSSPAKPKSQPRARKPKPPAVPSGYQDVIKAYWDAFRTAYGRDPGMTSRTGKAAKDLLAAHGLETVKTIIGNAFRDTWFVTNGGELHQIASSSNKYLVMGAPVAVSPQLSDRRDSQRRPPRTVTQ